MCDSNNSITVAYWLSEKKHKNLAFDQFIEYCRNTNVELKELDLDRPIDEQLPFDCLLHKLSDVWSKAEQGDAVAAQRWENLQTFSDEHPEIPFIDPLDAITLLCDRAVQYEFLSSVCDDHDAIRCPTFAKITSESGKQNAAKMQMMNVKYPAVCKPLMAHGSTSAHNITLVFNSKGTKALTPPQVAQTFHQHNGVLFKLFVIGDKHFITRRPSLKNFSETDSANNIEFDSHMVSKDGCENELTKCHHKTATTPPSRILDQFVQRMRQRTDMSLFGVDLIQDCHTGIYYAIDVNVFPSYDGVPNLFKHLLELLQCTARKGRQLRGQSTIHLPQQISHTTSVDQKPVDVELLARRRTTHWRQKGTNRCQSNLIDYEYNQELSKVQLPFDSGVGTSESETSDSCAKKNQQLLAHKESSQSLRKLSPVQRLPIFPDWQRIKHYYGIPKPVHTLTASNIISDEQQQVLSACATVLEEDNKQRCDSIL